MKWPQLPDYGCLHRWPEDGMHFIHPADVAVVTRFFPSQRVYRRDLYDGTYYHCVYGEHQFRLRPCLWRPVASDGIDVGDRVETVGLGMARELFVAHVCEMVFPPRKGRIYYRLRRNNTMLPALYVADELRLLKEKAKLKPTGTIHPLPQWNGQGERLGGIQVDHS